jgi:Tol biopolymer transport system component
MERPHGGPERDLAVKSAYMNLKFCAIAALAVICWTLQAGEEEFLKNARAITFEGKSGEGYFSPDGKNLIFQSVREPGNPFYQIYMLSLETGDVHRVSPGIGKTTCSFFRPRRDEVLFASTHQDPEVKKKQEDEMAFLASGKTRRYSWDYDEQMEIFSAKRDGTRIRRLTDAAGYDAEGSYSPDGKQIVFTSLRDAFPLNKLSAEQRSLYEKDPAYFGEIYIMNADGSHPRRLTKNPGYDGGPFFMPDGKRILWRHFQTNGVVADVFTMKTDGSDVRQVTHFDSMSWAPFPHPSGKYIIFTSNKHGFENFELFLVDSDGKQSPVRVTFTEGFDGLPVFSPDGKKICWTSNRGGEKQSQLFLADWNDDAALAALGLTAGLADSRETKEVSGSQSQSAEIRSEDARAYVSYLASDELEGRKTGERGARKAAEYIAGKLKEFGVQPLKGKGQSVESYFAPFEFNAGVEINKDRTGLEVKESSSEAGKQSGKKEENSAGATSYQVDKDFRPFSFSSNGEFEGAVVFAGYGLSVPGKGAEAYDSYSGLNVSNKLVLVLRYVPESVEPKRRQELNRYAAFRYKAMVAREHGAKGLLVVAGPNSPNSGKLVPLTSDGTLAGSEILGASISAGVADRLLAGSGKNLKELQSSLDTENPHAEKGFELPKTTVRLAVSLEHKKKEDRNVIGIIPGISGEYVMVGAHYDHLGFGDDETSRENKSEAGQVHNGADDNASGVSAVLELGGFFSSEKARPRRGIVFAFWSGEEMGLLGSSYFAEHPLLPLTNIMAYLNFDMVGRLHENKLMVQGAGSSPLWHKEIEKRNIAAGFDITMQDDPYLPSDTTALYPKGIPVLAFFTGSHDDYHRPSDDAEKLNYDGIEKITRLASTIVKDLVNAETGPEYAKVERKNDGGTRDALRAYLGSIPDYATEVQGVKLSGVRPGSPAEKGGLQGGDIIVEFGGQKIANIYDYTYALDAVKIGQPVEVKVIRKEQPVKLTVTPEARK